MAAIRIVCPGKHKEDWLVAGIQEYMKRLSSVWKIEWQILPDVSLKNAGSIESVKQRESVIISKALHTQHYNILLDEHGKSMTSPAFAGLINDTLPKKDITFVIGGVYGLDSSLYDKADLLLSFSIFTFPHQLIRLILMEQLYRAWTICAHKAYHY